MSGKPEVSNSIVAILGVLGQSDRMLEAPTMPLSTAAAENAARVVNETSIRNRMLRDAFASAFEGACGPIAHAADLLPKRLAPYATRGVAHAVYGFSDTIVVAVPLDANDHPFRVALALDILFNSLASFFILNLAQGVILRGGIEVGMAQIFQDGEISGAALAEAHRLESTVAQFPRIVIGQGMLALFFALRDLTEDLSDPEEQELVMDGLRKCFMAIEQDSTDNVMFLDYLSMFRASDGNPPEIEEAITRSYSMIETELQRHTQSRNRKVAKRYGRMLKYHDGSSRNDRR